MAKIQQLSPHLADLIAAGEVVERPASCAKELVENSIDAGATQITVEIQNGGMTYLRVTDNGCGIPADQLETAFLRHATSKLQRAEDLESIRTLGFRGEALAAISAVSRMDVMTKTEDATFGTGIHLEAGVVTERSEAGCPNGTTMIVRDLFYNTPARMKFMKSDSAESSALISSMQKLALAHPEISFRVIKDGQPQFQTEGDGSLYTAIYGVLGKLTAKDMIPVESRWDKYSLTGYVSKATAARGNRSIQILCERTFGPIQEHDRSLRGGLPQPSHGRSLPLLRPPSANAGAPGGCECPPRQGGSQIPQRTGCIRYHPLRCGRCLREGHGSSGGQASQGPCARFSPECFRASPRHPSPVFSQGRFLPHHDSRGIPQLYQSGCIRSSRCPIQDRKRAGLPDPCSQSNRSCYCGPRAQAGPVRDPVKAR